MVLLVLATQYLYIIALYLIIDNLAITYGSLAWEFFPDGGHGRGWVARGWKGGCRRGRKGVGERRVGGWLQEGGHKREDGGRV